MRLLRFLQSNDDFDGMRLQMEVYNLKSMSRRFVAISYTWGDSQDLTLINVNHQQFGITRHGAEALRRASQYDPRSLHWIE